MSQSSSRLLPVFLERSNHRYDRVNLCVRRLKRFIHSLDAICGLVFFCSFCGCNGNTPSTTGSSNVDGSGSNGRQVAKDSSDVLDSKTSDKALESQSDQDASQAKNLASQTPSANEPGAKKPPVLNAKDSKPVSKSDAARAGTGNSPTTKPVKPPAVPSPEEIAKWAVPNYEPLQLIACRDGFSDSIIQSMAISPDGKQFVLGGAKLSLWNLADSQPTTNVLANYKDADIERPIRSVAISPDGKWLAAGDQKGMLRIWSLNDQRQAVAIRAHDARLTRLAFSPNSAVLATTSYAGEVRLWQTSDGQKIKNLKVSDREIARLEFLSDIQLVCASKETCIWNVESDKKEVVLTTGSVIGPALGLSSDRKLLAFTDSDSKTHLWDVEGSSPSGSVIHDASAHLMAFSNDGKTMAIHSHDSNIRIWDVATRQLVQVIDGDGGQTVALKWLPQCNALLVASERGILRIWGTAESATAIGLTPMELPPVKPISADSRKSFSSAHWQNVIDVRSFPRLAGAMPQWSNAGIAAYTANSSQQAAELFYRYYLGKSGWEEFTTAGFAMPGLSFRKAGCELYVSLTPLVAPATTNDGNLQVSLQFAGNYDTRWLPKISAVESKSSWDSFSTVSYRTRAELTDVEVALLKQFHAAGWTAATRLNVARTENANSRSITMLQGGSVLIVSIGYPANSKEELVVQTNITVSYKSLPIPPDSGLIEFDSSTDLALVANTKLDLNQTMEFYDKEMASEGWMARKSGRQLKDEQGYLPYLRGQQDVLIRLHTRPEGGTRITVGKAEASSWQLQKPAEVNPAANESGIEAADFTLPKGATVVKFEFDQKQIEFEMSDVTPQALTEQFVKQLETADWKRGSAGVMSDDYCFVIFEKSHSKTKAEIELRIRGSGKKTSAMISGNGLLWSKPLPTPPVRVSYETWLRRSRKNASLDQLDEFSDEMHKIPVSVEKTP